METSTVSDEEFQGVRPRRHSLRDAMRTLDEALSMPAAGRVELWKSAVVRAAESFEADLVEHVAVSEGPDGFHAEIIAAAPRLAHAVDVLVSDHVELGRLAKALVNRVAGAETREDVDAVRELGTQLMTRLSRHRHRGTDLIYEAYEFDIGGED